MPEPTSTTASVVTLTTMAAATPVLHVAGVSLGLRPDAWRDFIITPESPLAVFGGGNG